MPEKSKKIRRRGRPPRHGIYSPVLREEFLRENPEVQRYIQAARDGLVRDQLAKVGGRTEDDLSAGQVLMIDRLVSRIALSRQIEVYLRRHNILRRDRLNQQILEAEPICQFWLQLQNSIDRGSGMLGIDIQRAAEQVEDIREYAKKKYGGQDDAGKGEGQGKAETDAGQDNKSEAGEITSPMKEEK
jgi:hypothetical protein